MREKGSERGDKMTKFEKPRSRPITGEQQDRPERVSFWAAGAQHQNTSSFKWDNSPTADKVLIRDISRSEGEG